MIPALQSVLCHPTQEYYSSSILHVQFNRVVQAIHGSYSTTTVHSTRVLRVYIVHITNNKQRTAAFVEQYPFYDNISLGGLKSEHTSNRIQFNIQGM